MRRSKTLSKKRWMNITLNAKFSEGINIFIVSIKKMLSQNLEFEDVYDIIAFRIILDTVPHCYEALRGDSFSMETGC